MAKSFPDFFPEGCPPNDASDIEMHIYRFCVANQVTEEDFRSYYELNPVKWSNQINAFGLSVMTDRDESVWALKTLPFIKKKFSALAEGETSSELGVIKHTPTKANRTSSHHTWWLYCDAKPHLVFSICGW